MRTLQLVKNIVGAAGGRAAGLLVSLATIPITAKALEADAYGAMAAAVSLSVVLNYADFGMSLALVNRIATDNASPTKIRSNRRVVSLAWFLLLCIAGTIAIAALALSAVLIYVSSYSFVRSAEPFLAALLCVAAGLPTGLAQRIQFALQMAVSATAWTTAGRLAALVMIWLLSQHGVSAPTPYILALLGVPVVVGWLMTGHLFMRTERVKSLRPRLADVDTRLVRPLVVNGSKYLTLQLVPLAETAIDSVLVAALVGLSAVMAFDVNAKLFGYIAAFVSIAAFPLWPAISAAKSSRDTRWIGKIVSFGLTAAALVSLLIATTFVLLNEQIITSWTGKSLTIEKYTLLGMAIFAVLTSVGTVQSMALNGLGALDEQIRQYVYYLGLLLLAKPIFGFLYGTPGVIWATNVCYVLRLVMGQVSLKRSQAA